MTEATCRRELELEVPAEDVQKAMERVAKEFARVARVPGFRPGKAPVTLIRRRYADDIKSEVLQSVVPDCLEHALTEKKMVPVTQPQVDKVDFAEGGLLKFRAVFEVLPEFELKNYKGLEIEIPALEVADADVEKTLEQMQENAATFVPVEGRAVQDGDFAQMKLSGVPMGEGEPVQADSVLCHIGAEETLEAFNENLRGANVGDKKTFEVRYKDDYPDPKLAAKVFTYTVELTGIKDKRKPELNDEFAKDVSDAATLADLRAKVRKDLEEMRDRRQKDAAREKILEKIVEGYDFPVPEALVEHQMDARVERTVRALAAQGVDPRAVNVDWAALRRRHHDHAVNDVRAELILDRVALAENIDVSDEDLQHELEHMATHAGESAEALRARLTKQGALDRMKSQLRSGKTIEWLSQNSRIQATAVESKESKTSG